jgi:hypothetical protein
VRRPILLLNRRLLLLRGRLLVLLRRRLVCWLRLLGRRWRRRIRRLRVRRWLVGVRLALSLLLLLVLLLRLRRRLLGRRRSVGGGWSRRRAAIRDHLAWSTLRRGGTCVEASSALGGCLLLLLLPALGLTRLSLRRLLLLRLLLLLLAQVRVRHRVYGNLARGVERDPDRVRGRRGCVPVVVRTRTRLVRLDDGARRAGDGDARARAAPVCPNACVALARHGPALARRRVRLRARAAQLALPAHARVRAVSHERRAARALPREPPLARERLLVLAHDLRRPPSLPRRASPGTRRRRIRPSCGSRGSARPRRRHRWADRGLSPGPPHCAVPAAAAAAPVAAAAEAAAEAVAAAGTRYSGECCRRWAGAHRRPCGAQPSAGAAGPSRRRRARSAPCSGSSRAPRPAPAAGPCRGRRRTRSCRS